jgi:type I restriction enzyme M protein
VQGGLNKHISKNLDRPKDFAVDGVINYANNLCKNFNVLAIAISGQTNSELKISHFIVRKGKFNKHEMLTDQYGNEVVDLLAFENYFNLFIYDPIIYAQKERDVLDFLKLLHNFIRDYAHLGDAEKPLIVSGILLALKDNVFFRTLETYPDDRLPKFTLAND